MNLYSNPLNRALGHKPNRDAEAKEKLQAKAAAHSKKPAAKTKSTPGSVKVGVKSSAEPTTDEVQRESTEMIAVDLNKYDSPMKELESKYEWWMMFFLIEEK